MGRKNHGNGRNIKVTREVIAMAALAAYRADQHDPDAMLLPGRVFGSRRITGRMLKALRGQVA